MILIKYSPFSIPNESYLFSKNNFPCLKIVALDTVLAASLAARLRSYSIRKHFPCRKMLTESGGFEPPVILRRQRFSRPPHSTSSANSPNSCFGSSLRKILRSLLGLSPRYGRSVSDKFSSCWKIYRRRKDSNLRRPYGLSGFQDRRIQPLCHSSKN